MAEEENCRNLRLQGNIQVFSLEYSKDTCLTEEEKQTNGNVETIAKTTYYTQGSSPPTDLKSELICNNSMTVFLSSLFLIVIKSIPRTIQAFKGAAC